MGRKNKKIQHAKPKRVNYNKLLRELQIKQAINSQKSESTEKRRE